MQGRFLAPSGKFRSPTAVSDKVDRRDENIYSSLVVAYGGAGSCSIFANPIGQTIPSLAGAAITMADPIHKTYTYVTTNLTKAGELGAGIGDAAIRAMGITIEQAGVKQADSTVTTYGATQQEMAEILSKCYFIFNVAAKPQIKGPIWAFPGFGGLAGSIASTQNAAAVAIANNGSLIGGRRLKLPIMVDRQDTLTGDFGVGGSGSLVFRTASAAGAETLVTVMFQANVDGDVR